MQIYSFGEFELDVDAQQLRLRGKPVHLERRPLDLLILLVVQHGRMVPREDIIAALWPTNVIIDFDSGLNTLVRKVRNALGDSTDDPRFVETVPGRGYRFAAPLVTSTNTELEQPATPAAKRPFPLAMALLTLVLIVAGTVSTWHTNNDESGPTRIAVLPFENLTGSDELAYMASGIAEETSMSLTRIDLPNLSVIGAVSTRALAGTAMSLQQIAHELGVDYIVSSSLRLENSRIRVTSHLIRVSDNEQLWTASFDRELTNILGLQSELSVAIAEQIRQRLSPEVTAIIDRRQTQNPEAYALYLKGRHEWTRFRPNSIQNALQYYRQAVVKDPGYALAWAGIAHALITSTVTAEAERQSVLPAAQDALQRALEFGPDLAETQLALGSFHFFLDQDLPPAEAAARKAVALDPNSAMFQMFLGMVLSQQNRHVEARAMLRRARELDPFFPLMFANSAVVALHANEPKEAIEFATQAIAIDPEFWVGYFHLGSALLMLGDYAGAIENYSKAEKLSGNNLARATALRAVALARLGREDEARDILAELTLRSGKRHVPPYSIARVHAALGEFDAAFALLEHALAENRNLCLDLESDRYLDGLRTDLRFDMLLQRCGFTPEQFAPE